MKSFKYGYVVYNYLISDKMISGFNGGVVRL